MAYIRKMKAGGGCLWDRIQTITNSDYGREWTRIDSGFCVHSRSFAGISQIIPGGANEVASSASRGEDEKGRPQTTMICATCCCRAA